MYIMQKQNEYFILNIKPKPTKNEVTTEIIYEFLEIKIVSDVRGKPILLNGLNTSTRLISKAEPSNAICVENCIRLHKCVEWIQKRKIVKA